MPQLDKASFHHQLVYVTLAIVVLYSVLSFIVMPEVFSNIFTRKFLKVSAEESWRARISDRVENSRKQNRLLRQTSQSHLEHYETLYEKAETFSEESEYLKKRIYFERYWKSENLKLKSDIFSLKKLL